MTESVDALLFEDPDFAIDPECDKQPQVPDGTYPSNEYKSRIVSLAPRKAGEMPFVSMRVLIQHPEVGGVFARTTPFGAGHTQLGKNSGSMWPQFAANLGIDGSPKAGESIGEYWARVAGETKDMAVTVTVSLEHFTRKEHRLPQEALDRGEVPIQTASNTIRNVVAG